MTQIVVVQPGQRTEQDVSSGGMPATVRVQTLGGTWETIGTDRARSIYAEGLSLTANTWGPDTCRFALKRSIDLTWPDLGAFTPCDVEIGGTVVWSGRIWQTPNKTGDDAAISIEGRGWQYHLDDDLYVETYLKRNMGDFVDSRSLLGANLNANQLRPQGQVSISSAGVSLSWPANTTFTDPAGSGGAGIGTYQVAATLDLGSAWQTRSPNGFWTVQTSQNWANNTTDYWNFSFTLNGSQDYQANPYANAGGGALQNASYTNSWSGSGSISGRYVHFGLYQSSYAGTFTPTKEFWVKLVDFGVGSNAPDGSYKPTLKASDVVIDALKYAPLLDARTNFITAATFVIPELAVESLSSPREVMTAVNAYHNYALYVDTAARLHWEPLPTAPDFAVGSWKGADFDDASSNSAEEVYNRALVQGTTPAGQNIIVERSSPSGMSTSSIQPTNPSFDTVTTGWSNNGTINFTRDTVVFDTTPASLRVQAGSWVSSGITYGSDAHAYTSSWTAGIFKKGRAYRVRARLRTTAAAVAIGYPFYVRMGRPATSVSDPGEFAQADYDITALPAGVWTTVEVVWRPKRDYVVGTDTVRFWVGTYGMAINTDMFYLDTVQVFEGGATLADRRNFSKTKTLPIQNAITVASGSQIGDVFLDAHRTTPMRGQLSVVPGGVRKHLDGAEVHPSELLIGTNKLIRFTDRIDPDTGNLGRDGRIAAVTYDHDAQTASVTIDNENRNFEALLARLAVVTGVAAR